MEEILISYVNLGTHFDEQENKIVPTLPKNNSSLKVLPLKPLWLYQEKMDPNSEKGTNGMIFPFKYNTFYDKEYIIKNNLCNNGIIFIDIDCGEDLIETIFAAILECNQRLSFPILGAAKTKKGLHLLVKSNLYTYKEFPLPTFYYLAAIAWTIKEITRIDLRKIHKALDACTFSMKQRLFLRYSKDVYWEDNATVISFDKNTKEKLKKEYNFIYERIEKTMRFNQHHRSKTVKKIQNGIIEEIRDPGVQPYLEHRGNPSRWNLYNSLCCCFPDENSVYEQWERCMKLIEPEKHDLNFFLSEPDRNHWYDRWQDDANHYCNFDLLEEFGYVFKEGSKKEKSIPMPKNIDELL